MTTAIVIGAGFGGMAAALRLRAAGMHVQIFDNQAQPGGRATVYRRAGYTFDAGPTVITAPFLFDELFALFGKTRADYVRFQELKPWYCIRFADGRTFDYGGTEAELIANVASFSPVDEAGYRNLLREVEKIYRVGFDRLADAPFDRVTAMVRLLPEMARLRSDRSVYSFVSRHIQDESLRRVFSFQPLLVGGNPFTTTSIYSLIQHLERTSGVHFAMGGTAALVAALVQLMSEEHVELSLNSPVAEVLITDGRARGVRLASGQEIVADVVVANADAPALYKKLVPARWRRKWTDRRIESRRYSMGLFVLYLGVRKTYPRLAHHTIVLGQQYRELLSKIFEQHEFSDDISLYLHAPTRTDRALAPPGCESLYALVPVPNLQADIDWAEKGPELERLTIDLLDRTVCPGLGDAVEVKFCVTPEHFKTELLTHHGSGFSIQPTFLQSAWFRFHNKSEDVEGLYVVGAGTHPGAGLPGVLCSAKVLETYVPEMLARGHQTAERVAETVMARSGKTFYRAAQLLPRQSRQSVMQLYSFCRLVDDLADESDAPASVRLQRLQELECALTNKTNGTSDQVLALHGWTPELAQNLRRTYFAASLLVHTAAGDLVPQQPVNVPQLERYAFGVAGTVGLMLCELLHAKPQGRTAAINLGIAMQLTNIARDVAKDFGRTRIYLPSEWVSADLVHGALTHGERAACKHLCRATYRLLALAETHYNAAFDGIWTLPWRVRWSILAAGMCYREIGRQVGQNVPASWLQRTVVSSARKTSLILLAALRLLHPALLARRARLHTNPVPASSPMTYDCDILILGGGCAGLSLAAALTEAGSSLRVKILEPRSEYKRDRTWCFWKTEPHPFESCVTHRWKSWSVSKGSRCITRSSRQYAYEHIPADRFYEAAIAGIECSETQELCRGVNAAGVSALPNGYKVESSSGSLSTRFVFDSRPLRPATATATASWTQRFTGWHVCTETPAFNPSTVELMNFEPVTVAGRILFFYILPFATDEAMVEATCLDMPGLSASDLEPELRRWLEEKTGGGAYEVLFREQGALPMTRHARPSRPVEKGYGIGIRGGRIKPSSGYAFLRIQRQSRLLAQALTTNQRLPQQFEPAHYAQLDGIFLQALTQSPATAPDFFLRLFERTPADVLVRFLSECGSLRESLQTALALPRLPFIKAALMSGRL